MKDFLFGDSSLTALRQALDGTSLRHRVIANNLANAETPGFVPQRLLFQQQLETFLAYPSAPPPGNGCTQPAHIPVGQPTEGEGLSWRLQAAPGLGLEESLVDLVENSYLYTAAAKLLAARYAGLHTSIRGRVG